MQIPHEVFIELNVKPLKFCRNLCRREKVVDDNHVATNHKSLLFLLLRIDFFVNLKGIELKYSSRCQGRSEIMFLNIAAASSEMMMAT